MTNQLHPLERMFPTPAIRWGLLALLGTPVAAISLGELIPIQLLNATTTQIQLAKIAIFLALLCLVAFLIILNYALLLNVDDKHLKLIHVSNVHPQMSARWLFENATWKHYLTLVFLLLSFFAFGFYVAQP
jgi:hypothetical protein